MSAVVPMRVPAMRTEAPISGSFISLSMTTPLMSPAWATATTAVINATVKLHFFDKLILMPLFVRCKSRHIAFQKAYKKMNLLRQYLIVTCS